MRVIIIHPEAGIFLGACMGLGFWSKLDPAGQVEAVTFPDETEAKRYLDSWPEQPTGLEVRSVQADGEYISMVSLIKQGFEGWDHPTLNKQPI